MSGKDEIYDFGQGTSAFLDTLVITAPLIFQRALNGSYRRALSDVMAALYALQVSRGVGMSDGDKRTERNRRVFYKGLLSHTGRVEIDYYSPIKGVIQERQARLWYEGDVLYMRTVSKGSQGLATTETYIRPGTADLPPDEWTELFG